MLLLFFWGGYQLHVGHSQGLRPFISSYWTVQNADCRPLFSGLESNGTILFSPSFAWWKQWSAAVCGLHFVRTVLATKISGSNFGPHWLSPLHCHGRCESIVFSCSFQTGILLNLLSAVHISTMLPFFPPKRSRRWNFGKGEARNGWMPFLDFHCRSEQMTNFSTEEHLPTPRFRVNSALWPVPYACAQPYHHSSGSPYWG